MPNPRLHPFQLDVRERAVRLVRQHQVEHDLIPKERSAGKASLAELWGIWTDGEASQPGGATLG